MEILNRYLLDVNAILVILYIGFYNRRSSVTGKESINITLLEDAAKFE